MSKRRNISSNKDPEKGIDFATHLERLNRASEKLERHLSPEHRIPKNVPNQPPTPNVFPRSAIMNLLQQQNPIVQSKGQVQSQGQSQGQSQRAKSHAQRVQEPHSRNFETNDNIKISRVLPKRSQIQTMSMKDQGHSKKNYGHDLQSQQWPSQYSTVETDEKVKEENKELKWRIMKLTAENIELKVTNEQITKAGSELLFEYKKLDGTNRELKEKFIIVERAMEDLRQEIGYLKDQLIAALSKISIERSQKSQFSCYNTMAPENEVKKIRRYGKSVTIEESKPIQKQKRVEAEVSSMFMQFQTKNRIDSPSLSKNEKEKHHNQSKGIQAILSNSNSIETNTTKKGKFETSNHERILVHSTESGNSVTSQNSKPLPKYTGRDSLPSTSKLQKYGFNERARAKPVFEFQFKNITQSLKRSKNITNFLPKIEDSSSLPGKSGSDSTNINRKEPYKYNFSGKSFINAILGLRDSSSAVLDPIVKEVMEKRKTEDQNNSNI